MDCLTARVVLISKGTRQTVVDGDYIAAKRHVAACQECQGFLEQEERFDEILKSKLPRKPVPNALRENILAVIASEQKQKTTTRKRKLRRRRVSFVGVTAAVLLVTLSYVTYPIIFQRGGEIGTAAVSTLVQEHISRTLRENPLDVQTSDSAELERWFALRVDFIVNVPELQNATLLGGRLCFVGGQRTVALTYQKETVPITMYIMDRDVINLSSMQTISAIDTKRIFHADAKGCNMIFWEEKGLVYGLASDMNEYELVKLIENPS